MSGLLFPKPPKRQKKKPKPIKRSAPPGRSKKPHRKAIREKDAEVQKAVAGYGECTNCRKWKMLGGDHRKKRRYLASRHDLANIDPTCWECNVDLESLTIEKLLAKYTDSNRRREWMERYRQKYGIEIDVP